MYFVDLAETFAVQDNLVAIAIEKANSDIFVGSAVDEVFKDADIRRVGCLDLEVQGVATSLGSDIPCKYPGEISNNAKVSG